MNTDALRRCLSKMLTLVLISLAAVPCFAEKVSLSSLLDEMVDHAAITRYPNYLCKQASSYDRAAKSPEENWFANGDASQFIREETNGDRKEWVLMETEGPGAIVRWWITGPHYKNNVYIYIDGASEPTFSGKIDDIVGGSLFAGAPLSADTSRGRNLYLPIPYAKSVKVTCDKMEEQNNLYYQINYRTYGEGTEVESMTPEILSSQKDKIAATNVLLLDPEKAVVGADGQKEIQGFRRHIDSEQLEGLLEKHSVFGPGVITEIKVKLTADDPVQALRSVVLSISFDGEETVWVPVGEFFGSGVGVNPYKSWYAEVLEDGTMKSFWRMPFKREAQVSFINYGSQDVDVDYEVSYEKAPWTDDLMYFHANWRQERGIKTIGGNGTKDWNYTTLHGKGVYVGDVLSVFNPVEAWWGEGDEKIYVDNESFPSHFGTGSEDYYGYAWCTPLFFESPFHAQPRCEGPSNFGNTTNLRYRLLDGIPFTENFVFDMEVWHWTEASVDYAVATFWYGLPGASIDATKGPQRNELEDEAAEPVQYNHKLAIRVKSMEVADSQTQGRVETQHMSHFEKNGHKWQDSRQIFWRDGMEGDEITISVTDVPLGKKTIILGTTAARDYGVVQFSWNGVEIGKPVDFFNSPDVIHKTIRIDVPETTEDHGVLSVKLFGKNESSVGLFFGVDSVSWE